MKKRTSLAEKVEQSPALFLALFTLVFFLARICANSRTAFWFDELLTYSLANLPSISQIWPLCAQGIEINPPLPFWITWLIHHFLGKGEVLTRLPAVFGFWCMCLCLFHFVRRRSDALHGFLALLIPVFTYTAWDSSWARGYGMLLGFSGIALLSWQLSCEGIRRPLTLATFALSIAAAVSCHYYAVYVAAAICAGELVRTWSRRKIDFPFWAALAAGLSPLIAFLPLLRIASAASHAFWIKPQARFLYETYADLFGPAAIAILLLLAAIIYLPSRPGGNSPARQLPTHELVTAVILAGMPLAVYLATFVSPAAFFPRYVQPAVLGFAILCALFLYKVCGANPRYRNAILTIAIWACFLPWALWQISKVAFSPTPAASVMRRIHLPADTSLPVVVDHDNDFLMLYHYGPPEVRSRLFILLDASASVQYLGADTAARTLRLAQTFEDFHVVEYRKFIAAHREFYIARTASETWMIQKLLADGAKLELVSLDKEKGFFVPDSLMFRVRIP